MAPTTPLWVLILTSLILPGLGHLILGRRKASAVVFGSCVLAQAAALGALWIDSWPLMWICTRWALLVYLYGTVDAALAGIEQGDGRSWRGRPAPRQVALFNLVLPGLGHWRMDERGLAIVGFVLGAAHVASGFLGFWTLLVAELLVASLAYLAFRQADADSFVPFTPGSKRSIDTTPGWLMPAFAAHAGFLLLLAMASTLTGNMFLRGSVVNQERAVVVEPYYHNPTYSLSLEMNAPGWAFGKPEKNDFVVARHVAERTSVRVSSRARFPGQPSETFVATTLLEARERGYMLTPTSVEECQLDALPGVGATAEGTRNGEPVRVAIFTAGRDWRQLVVWFEWDPRHDSFARSEMQHFLAKMRLEV